LCVCLCVCVHGVHVCACMRVFCEVRSKEILAQ